MPVLYPHHAHNSSDKTSAPVLRPPLLLLHGTFIDAPTPHELRVRRNYFCGVDVAGGGRIVLLKEGKEREEYGEVAEELRRIAGRQGGEAEQEVEYVKMERGQAVAVGVVDCHIHAPQFPQLHTKTTVPLLTWLTQHTFPLESRYSDPTYAHKTYPPLLRRLLRNATTTAVYFSSRHLESTKILATTAASYGQRALIGKVCSDQLVPEYYSESIDEAVGGTEEFIRWCYGKWGDGENALVKPVVTPRFVPTCSRELLGRLGEVVGKFPGVHVQTHAAESVDEVLLVAELHPKTPRGIALLNSTNLLTPSTILAHCTHLSRPEAHQLVALDVGIVSCPYSNMLFARSVVPITEYYHLNDVGNGGVSNGNQEAINMKKIAFGTDISGGPSSSLWVNMRLAILQDRIKSYRSMADYPRSVSPSRPILTSPPTSPPSSIPQFENDSGPDETSWTMTHTYAYHIATVGGAETVGMGELLGRWEVGRLFDGFLVDWVVEERDGAGGSGEAGFDGWIGEEKNGEEEVEWIRDGWERFVMGGDDRNILRVWVGGKLVLVRS
ncbi:hypothetical protein DFH27DRAFT_564882 [Peziza echinospora]|nr:hypothetical protein DFH27DRAFT_564882 [Peziza echinospora]